MSSRPNILVLLTDQQRWDALGCNGNRAIQTPNLDALAAAGVNFANAYVNFPLCLPNRCSMITGLFPSAHGSQNNGIALAPHFPVYPELLRQAGYQTFASGKLHLAPISRGWDSPPYEPGEVPEAYPYYGFERVYFVEGEKSPYLAIIAKEHPELLEAANHRSPLDASRIFQLCHNPIPEALNRSTLIADHALAMLEARDPAKPFLMHCSFWDPHHPFDPSPPFDAMYDWRRMPDPIPFTEGSYAELPSYYRDWREKDNGQSGKAFAQHTAADWKRMAAAYYGMISLIDKQVGRVMAYLQAERLLDNTAVFFLSDHGELLGDHGIALKGAFNYEGLIRVPFIARLPGLNHGTTSRDLVQTYDLAPTLLDLAGLPHPRLSARSLIPLLAKRTPARDAVCIEQCRNHQDLDDGSAGVSHLRTVIHRGHKLIMYTDREDGILYDLENDPREMHNAWHEKPEMRAVLLHRLAQLEIEAVRPGEAPIGRW